MPDRDSILKGLPGLPVKDISFSEHDPHQPPDPTTTFNGEENGARYWVTRERFLNLQSRIVLRTTGDRQGRMGIEHDFVSVLGKPTTRSSEIGHPLVESTSWTISAVKRNVEISPDS
jgi:hypothetical protein